METIIKFDRTILKDWQDGFCRVLIVLGILYLFLILFLGLNSTFNIFIVLGIVAFICFLPWAYAWIKLAIYNGPQIVISEAGVNFKNKNFYKWDEISKYWVMRFTTSETGGETGSQTYTTLVFNLKNGFSVKIHANYFPLDVSPDEIVAICDSYKSDKKRTHSMGFGVIEAEE